MHLFYFNHDISFFLIYSSNPIQHQYIISQFLTIRFMICYFVFVMPYICYSLFFIMLYIGICFLIFFSETQLNRPARVYVSSPARCVQLCACVSLLYCYIYIYIYDLITLYYSGFIILC